MLICLVQLQQKNYFEGRCCHDTLCLVISVAKYCSMMVLVILAASCFLRSLFASKPFVAVLVIMLTIVVVCCDLCSEVFMIFSGGMPRASHGVRHTVSVLRGAHDHVVFDVTSKVVDFIVLCNGAKHEQGRST